MDKETAIILGVYATFALDCYSTFCSSPQTTELNAKARSETLMKWVMIGGAVAVSGGLIATAVGKSPWPLVGAGSISVLMFVMYSHAKKVGLESDEPGTERY